jgi:hypothetical protein
VEVLTGQGHDVVAMSRSGGVDVITGDGLAAALAGAAAVIDVATGPSLEPQAATEFFTTAARNLHQAAGRAGVRRIVVASIIGIDRFTGGYNAAKVAHENAMLAGPVPVRVLCSAQFHEFVAQIVTWGTQGEVAYVPAMRTQLVAARTVAEALAGLATSQEPATPGAGAAPVPEIAGPRPENLAGAAPVPEIAGPRPENLADMATLLVARHGPAVKIEAVSNPASPQARLLETGALLPGPGATLAGPTFEQWLDATY